MKKVIFLFACFLILSFIDVNVFGAIAGVQAQPSKLETIKSGIPQKWWEEGSWDKSKELEDFVSGYQAKDSTGADAHFWLGCNYRVSGDYDKALLEFEKVVTEYPTCQLQVMKSQFETAQIYFWFNKDYDSALAQYRAVASLYPNTWEGKYSQEYTGYCFIEKGDEQKALIEFQKAYEQGRITAGIAIASIFLRQASGLPSASASEKDYRDKKFKEVLSFYKKLYQSCPIEEDEGAAIGQIIDGASNAFAKCDGNIIRSTQFVRFQKYGPSGKDKIPGTADDLTDPLAEF